MTSPVAPSSPPSPPLPSPGLSLLDLAPGQDAVIDRIEAAEDEGPLLRAMGLLEGERVRVLRRALFGGPLQVRVGEACFAVGRALAGSVRVRAAEAP